MEQPEGSAGRALVVVVDDRQARGVADDHSGALVTELLARRASWWTALSCCRRRGGDPQRAEHGGDRRRGSWWCPSGAPVTPRDVTPEATRASWTGRCPASPRRSAPPDWPRAAPTPALPWAGRHLRQHSGGQYRRIPIGGARRHGNTGPDGSPCDRRAVQPGNLTGPRFR